MTLHHPARIYCASKLIHAPMWREWKTELSPSTIHIVSTWHDSENILELEGDSRQCYIGWLANRRQVTNDAEHLLVFGNEGESLNGTMIEIGMALAYRLQIHLVGTYPWGTWRFLDEVHIHPTLHAALCDITGVDLHFPIKEHLLNDPT